jgi:AcrR family transcriptional regulator
MVPTMAHAKKTQGLRRNLKEDQRRKQIKEAAVNLFSAKGYQQSTMEDLAEEAGVSKSLIYWYWKSKAALLSELINTCMQSYVDLLSAAALSEEPFIKKLHRFLWEFSDLFRKNDRLNKLVHFCSVHTPKNRKENFSVQVNAHYHKILMLLETLMEQAVGADYLPIETDCSAVALSLLSLVEGHIYMTILEDRHPLDRLIASFLQLAFRQELRFEGATGENGC